MISENDITDLQERIRIFILDSDDRQDINERYLHNKFRYSLIHAKTATY